MFVYFFLQPIGICGFKGSTLFLIYVVTHKGLSHIIKSSICFTKSADVKCGISEKSYTKGTVPFVYLLCVKE